MTKPVVMECLIEDKDRVRRLFPVFSVLRPHLSESEFIASVKTQMHEGYKIVSVEVEPEPAAHHMEKMIS